MLLLPQPYVAVVMKSSPLPLLLYTMMCNLALGGGGRSTPGNHIGAPIHYLFFSMFYFMDDLHRSG